MSEFESPVRVVRAGAEYQGRQGLAYRLGLTAKTVGSKAVSMTVATLPPGARSKAHLHRAIETAIYVIDGEAVTCYGDQLEHQVITRSGDYIYIAPDTPHLVTNRSAAPCVAAIVHTGADDQDGIVLLPELDSRV